MAETADNLTLTPKQAAFCREYLVDFNGKQAAIRAGYSKDSAESTASEILSYPKVINEIERLAKVAIERSGIAANRLIRELASVAFSDIGDAVDFGPGGATMTSSADMAPQSRRAIQSVTYATTKDGDRFAIKQYDKLKAIELLGRYHGLWDSIERRLADMDARIAAVESGKADATKPEGETG